MNKDQWQQIEKIFYAAMELPHEEREAFIRQTCAGDEDLLREVQALLEANQDAKSFLDAPVQMPPHSGTLSPTLVMPHPAANVGAAVESGVRIGAYRLIREIGRGGMGAVWLAERDDGHFYQQVAIKLLHAGSENEEVIRRFRHERQILASLDHPNIARLLDGGTTEDGRPYFVMEYIEGQPIDDYCRQHQISVDDRLRLFRQVCAAVHYAHQNLVIHRDLKPSNIAVTEDGTPKLLDFGIAKLVHPDLSRSYETLDGMTPMTPAYASPEQVRGEKLTTASDVYSLGVVLYELLTGRSPYRLKAQAFGELMRAIIEQEPERPSTAITRADGAPPTNPITVEPTEKLRRRLSGDIDSIVLMTLRKEPPSRYGSVEQFSEDLRRYLEGLPTIARRGTFGYRALKYVRRNKVPVAAAALILLSLFGGIGATLQQARIAKAEKSEAQSQRNRAEDALLTAEERRQQAEAARTEANQQKSEAEEQRNDAEEQKAEAERQRRSADDQRTYAEQQTETNRRLLYASNMNLAQQQWEALNIPRMQELLDSHIPSVGQNDLRGFEWYHLWWRIHHRQLLTFKGHTSGVRSVAFSPDGKRLATSSYDKTVKLWDLATGQELITLKGHEDQVLSVTFSPDGKRLATGGSNQTTKLWDAASGQELITLKGHLILQSPLADENTAMLGIVTNTVFSVAFSPDGKLLAVGSGDKTVRLWDATTGQELLTLKGQTGFVRSVAFSPDGKRLAAGSDRKTMLWDVATGQELISFKGHSFGVASVAGVNSVAFSPDSRRLATGSSDKTAKLWDATTSQELTTLKGHTDSVYSVAFSPDGKWVATGSSDKTVKLWDAATGQELLTLKELAQNAISVAFSPDGKRLATGGGQVAKLWDVTTSQELITLRGHAGLVHSVAFSPDGRRLATGGGDKIAKLWDAATGQELVTFKGHADRVWSVAFSPDGRRLATGSLDKTVKLWNAATGQELLTLKGHASRINSVAFSPDGRRLATGSYDKTVKLWDAAIGQELLTLHGHTDMVCSVAFSPDGRQLATGSTDKTVKLWDAATGQELITLKGQAYYVKSVAFSPNGKRLATGNSDQTARLWDVTTGQELITLKGHAYSVNSVVFSPDGKRLATGSEDKTTKLWDVATGQELLSLQGHAESVWSVAFSPDGKRLATGSYDKTVKLWDAASKQEVLARSKQ